MFDETLASGWQLLNARSTVTIVTAPNPIFSGQRFYKFQTLSGQPMEISPPVPPASPPFGSLLTTFRSLRAVQRSSHLDEKHDPQFAARAGQATTFPYPSLAVQCSPSAGSSNILNRRLISSILFYFIFRFD